MLVIAVRVVRHDDAQPVSNSDTGRDNQEAARELLAIGVADGIDGLPGDQHGHDGRFARPGRELEGKAQ